MPVRSVAVRGVLHGCHGLFRDRHCRGLGRAYGGDFIRAVSSDKNVAEYRGGYIIGKGIGECKIFIKSENGSISRELRVTVKKNRKFW